MKNTRKSGKKKSTGGILRKYPWNSFPVVLLAAAVLISSVCIKSSLDNKAQFTELAASLQEEKVLVRKMIADHEELLNSHRELEEQQNRTPEAIPYFIPVETITEVPVYIEKEKIVSQEFRIFKDEAELAGWLDEHCLPLVLAADANGSIDFRNPRMSTQYDCDDYSETLQKKALEQGYLMSQQLVLNGRLFGVRVSQNTSPHMGNLAVAGEDIYYVESIPPHKIVKIVSRD
ncbi:hypothetical protein ACFLUG_01370 [Chloroflexota bacterium]